MEEWGGWGERESKARGKARGEKGKGKGETEKGRKPEQKHAGFQFLKSLMTASVSRECCGLGASR